MRIAARALVGSTTVALLVALVPLPLAGAAGAAETVTLAQIPSSPREQVPSALDDPTAEGLPKPLVNPAQLRSGGPPPDGIPAIDRPRFQRAGTVDWLDPREPVLAFEHGNDARAFPVRVLIWHEIVNDTVDGLPVAITFCPLCNSAIAFDRRAAGRVLDFGTSGLLYRSDLVMYDRQTRSLWPQFEGRAIAGVLTGTGLTAFPVSTVSWRDWRDTHPDAWVLSRDTGYDRPYGTNPYAGYDNENDRPFLYSGKIDRRLPPKARVVGIDDQRHGVAVTFKALRRRRIVDVTGPNGPVSIWWQRGTRSALDAASISAGRDVGAAQAYATVSDGRTLHFTPTREGAFRDRETGTTWNFFGRAVAGPLAGRTLTSVAHLDTFWFAWSAFHPQTAIIGRHG